jgi:hypothetical protein
MAGKPITIGIRGKLRPTPNHNLGDIRMPQMYAPVMTTRKYFKREANAGE